MKTRGQVPGTGRRAPRSEGTAMRVLAIESRTGRACCAGIDAIARTVETALVGAVQPGDVLLVHAGVALLRLDAEWAP